MLPTVQAKQALLLPPNSGNIHRSQKSAVTTYLRCKIDLWQIEFH